MAKLTVKELLELKGVRQIAFVQVARAEEAIAASAAGMNYCFEKAGKSCGADGYLIVGADGTVLGDSEVAASDTVKVVKAWQTDRNSIYVRCDT